MGEFFPGEKFGGPPVSVDNFCTLMDEYECYIVTTNHDYGDKKPYSNINAGWNDRGNCKVVYLSEEQFKYKMFEKYINEITPDILYLQGLFQKCVFPCLLLAKKHNLPTIVAPRGELCSGAFKKKYKKVPYIICLRIFGLLNQVSFQSTSDDETKSIQKRLKVSMNQIHYLDNVPSIPKCQLSHFYKQSGEMHLIYLSRIVPKKNLLFAIKCLCNLKGKVSFDIYGPIEDKNYWKECQNVINGLPNNICVKYCGLVNHSDVHLIFSRYDAFIFPTKSENYGHVIVEAMVAGCPVIISNQTPWNDINQYKCGWALPIINKEEFENALQLVLDSDEKEMNNLRNQLHDYINIKLKFDSIKTSYKIVIQNVIYEQQKMKIRT